MSPPAVSTPIPIGSSLLNKLSERLRVDPASAKHVRLHPILMPSSNCYGNAQSFVNHHGGRVVIGWMMRMWPKVCLCAEFHAVVETRDGELIDVTEPIAPGAENGITFIPAVDQSFDLSNPPHVMCRNVPLVGLRQLKSFIAAYQAYHESMTPLRAFSREVGVDMAVNFLAKAEGRPEETVELTDAQAHRYQALSAKMFAASDAMRAAKAALITALQNQGR